MSRRAAQAVRPAKSLLDAKARKWLHPGLGGGAVKVSGARPSRAEVLAELRAGVDAHGWGLGLPRAGKLRAMQARVLEFVADASKGPAEWDAEFEAALVRMASSSAVRPVQVWVGEAGLAFALEALWRYTSQSYDFRYAGSDSSYALCELENNFMGGPDDGWWMLRRLAATVTEEDRLRGVEAGKRLRERGWPTLSALVALVLPEPDWVESLVSDRGDHWLWSMVQTAEQAERVRARMQHSDAGRFLMSWHAADLVDRLGAHAVPSLEGLLRDLRSDLAAYRSGNHDLQLAVARVEHVLLLASAGA